MNDTSNMVRQESVKSGFSFYYLPVAGLLVLLTIASCTSQAGFNVLYNTTFQSLSLGSTSQSAWLLAHPGVGHMLGYALLTLTLSAALSHRRLFVAPLAISIFGVLMEGMQIFIPTRGASLADIGSNVAGIVVGLISYLLWRACAQYAKRWTTDRAEIN